MTKKWQFVKRTESVWPGEIAILPSELSWTDMTPIFPSKKRRDRIRQVTHLEHKHLRNAVATLGVYSYSVFDQIQMLMEATGVEAVDTEETAAEIDALFRQGYTAGVAEFSRSFCRMLLQRCDAITFSRLVRIDGMAHSTNAWLGNGEEWIAAHGFDELIGGRDDVLSALRRYGVDRRTAYGVMRAVSMGRFGRETDENRALLHKLEQAKVPEWYIRSMKRIRYLFPKAQAVSHTQAAVLLAWFKVRFPSLFYRVTLRYFHAEDMAQRSEEEWRQRLEELKHVHSNEKEAILLLLEAHERGYGDAFA